MDIQAIHDHAVQVLAGKVPGTDRSAARALFAENAARGHVGSMVFLGIVLLDGVHGPQDIPAGVVWVRKAADAGHSEGEFLLGMSVTMAGLWLASHTSDAAAGAFGLSQQVYETLVVIFRVLAIGLGVVIGQALGGVLGIVLAFIAFNGRTTSTLGAGFTQLVFKFELSPGIIVTAIIVAVIIGLFGGMFPGIRAARQRPQLELASQ